MVREIINSRFALWLVLALPSVPMVAALLNNVAAPNGEPAVHQLLHPTGEFAARFLIIAMIITPMRMLFPVSKFWHWLARRRRYFGVAAFAYGLAHTTLYVVDMGSLRDMFAEFWLLGIWTGWAAFAVFVPLAATSNDWAVRKMGPSWKHLQRLVYIAALATLVHWIFVHNNLGPALVHFMPLAALEIFRLARIPSLSERRKRT